MRLLAEGSSHGQEAVSSEVPGIEASVVVEIVKLIQLVENRGFSESLNLDPPNSQVDDGTW